MNIFVKLMQNKPITELFVEKLELISLNFAFQMFFNMSESVVGTYDMKGPKENRNERKYEK